MIGLTASIPLGHHVMNLIGSSTAMAGGIGRATQTLVSGGMLGMASSLLKR